MVQGSRPRFINRAAGAGLHLLHPRLLPRAHSIPGMEWCRGIQPGLHTRHVAGHMRSRSAGGSSSCTCSCRNCWKRRHCSCRGSSCDCALRSRCRMRCQRCLVVGWSMSERLYNMQCMYHVFWRSHVRRLVCKRQRTRVALSPGMLNWGAQYSCILRLFEHGMLVMLPVCYSSRHASLDRGKECLRFQPRPVGDIHLLAALWFCMH